MFVPIDRVFLTVQRNIFLYCSAALSAPFRLLSFESFILNMNQLNQYRFLEENQWWGEGVRHVERVWQVIPQSICNCCSCCCRPMKRAADPQTVAKYFKIAKRLQWNRRQQQQQQLIQLSNTTRRRRRRKGDQCKMLRNRIFIWQHQRVSFRNPNERGGNPGLPRPRRQVSKVHCKSLAPRGNYGIEMGNGEWEVMQSQARESDRNRWVSEWVREWGR